MKRLLLMIPLLLMSYHTPAKQKIIVKTEKNSHVLLVLQNTLLQSNNFSIFSIEKMGDIIIGINLDPNNYPVKTGIYRIESTSNDYFYHKRIMIIN